MKKLVLVLLASSPIFGWTILTPNLRGWDTKTLAIGVNTSGCTISDSALYAVVDEAIAAWNGIPMADLTLSRVDSTSTAAQILAGTSTDDPVIACDTAFGTNVGDSDVIPGVTVGVQMNSGGHIVQGGMILNAEAAAAANIANLSHDELVIVVAHELGHALGLGHSNVIDALMYYSIAGKDTAVITEDDMDGMAFLYPRNEFSGKPLGCSAVHEPRTTVPSEWMATSAILTILTSFGTILYGRRIFKPLRPEPLP